MGPADDSRLVELATAGDSDAFTELVRKYRDAVYGYCYYRVGAFEDARDLCQETFVLAYTKLRQLREPEKFGAWTRRIAANLCTRWCKARREFPSDEIALVETRDVPPAAAFVREALTSLPDNERLAVVMHYVDGLSYGEIADFLEVSKGAVRGRIYRGREALREEVLKMTKDTFEDNKLDEEFVIQAVRAALDESQKALYKQRDRVLAEQKMDEAASLLEQITSSSEEARRARLEMVDARANLDLSLGRGHWSTGRYEALRAAEELGDPRELARELKHAASWELTKRDRERGWELLDRARSIYTELADPAGLADCDELSGFVILDSGDLRKAHELYSNVLEIRQSVPTDADGAYSKLSRTADAEAMLRVIEAIGLDTPWDRVRWYTAGSGYFANRDEMIAFIGGAGATGWNEPGFYIARRTPPQMAAHPARLLPRVVELGKEWSASVSGIHSEFYEELSRVESVSETVTTPAGAFADCVRTSRCTTQPEPEDDVNGRWLLGKRAVWFAPGVGIVKIVYEPVTGDVTTWDLAEFHVGGQDPGYIPLEVGNRWRYRWVEREEQHGSRTQDCIEITARGELTTPYYLCLLYSLCVDTDQEPAVQR